MAHYTKLTTEEFKVVLADYDITKVISWKILSGGSENTNFLVESEKGKLVLTFCEQKTMQEANQLADLLEHLNHNGFSTSKVLSNNKNQLVNIWKGKPFMVKAFLGGEVIEDIPNDLLVKIGNDLGALHQIESPAYLPQKCAYGEEYFKEMHHFEPDGKFTQWLNDIHLYLQEFLGEDLPKALIHSDIFYNNIIIDQEKNTATIMDFEEACYYYRLFDIGMIIVGVCSKGTSIDLEKTKHLLRGYRQIISLRETEEKALKAFAVYAAAATAFWRYKNFRFTKPDPNYYDKYVTMKELADHIKAFPDDCFASSK